MAEPYSDDELARQQMLDQAAQQDQIARRRGPPDAPRALPMLEDGPRMGVLADDGSIRITRRGDSAVVDFAPGPGSAAVDDDDLRSENLAETLDQSKGDALVNLIIEQVDADLRSRQPWEERIDQAMVLLGIQNKPLEDLPFVGAAAVTYPLIGEACVQFQARAIEEVFPSDGPCKTKVVGKRSRALEEQAERVAGHMNYQMMEEDRAYFWHVDQMLFWLPIFGSAFKKTYYDPVQKMVISRLVPPGDFIVPYHATDLYTSPRHTHRMYKTRSEMDRLMTSGFYRKVELYKTGGIRTDEAGSAKEMLDTADDRVEALHEDDDIFTLYEMSCDVMLDEEQKAFFGPSEDRPHDAASEGGDQFALPYIVTIEKETRQLLAIRRNWKEGDDDARRRQWFTHYKYLPGLGFYGFGLLHMIGSLSEATTGTLRAVLDMAAFAGLQGGFMSDDAQLPEGENHIEPGVYKRTKMTAEELARAFYTPPFKDPPEAMYRIFEVLIEAGRRFASTTEEMVGDASNTGPVGTTIALIEQSSKVFSGIHRRLHVAQAEELSLRAELNAEFLPEEYPYEIEGESRVIFKRDYDAKVDVIPVSDPNIFSSAQRIAQGQAVLELAERFPAEIDSTDAVKRFLKAIKVPDYETLLKTGSQVRRDAVSENMLIMVGKPVKAFAEQDHDAHIAVHMGLMGAINDDAKGVVGMAMQAHLAEHYAFAYYNVMNQQAGGMLPPPTWMDGSDSDEEPPPEADMLISQAAAQMQVPQIMPPTEGGPDAEAMEAEAKIARAQQQFEAEQANRQRAFEADEARKQQAADAEEYRKSVAFDADEERKDAATEAEMDRKLALAINEDERKTYSAEQADARAQISERRAARTKPKAGGK